jgi:hypothetical protein
MPTKVGCATSLTRIFHVLMLSSGGIGAWNLSKIVVKGNVIVSNKVNGITLNDKVSAHTVPLECHIPSDICFAFSVLRSH